MPDNIRAKENTAAHEQISFPVSKIEPSKQSTRADYPDVVTQLSPRRRRVSEPGQFNSNQYSAKLDPQHDALLARMREAVEQLPDFDPTRVVQLHQRLLTEDYQVDSARLTERLLALESALDHGQSD